MLELPVDEQVLSFGFRGGNSTHETFKLDALALPLKPLYHCPELADM